MYRECKVTFLKMAVVIVLLIIFAVLETELKTSHMLVKCSTT
jgi:hypothetical protein